MPWTDVTEPEPGEVPPEPVPAPQPTPEPEPEPVPDPNLPTVLDIAFWNVASPRWFTPWSSRGTKIGKELSDLACSIVCTAETHFAYQTADILKALGPQYVHVSSPIGNDIFFDGGKYRQHRPYAEYSLGAQNRYAGVLHLTRIDTGRKLTVVNTHFPNGSVPLRATAAKNLVKLLADVDDAIILTGDFNNQSYIFGTPHYYIRKAGYVFMRKAAAIVNADVPEFPAKKKWLSDIATDPTEAKITGGELVVTSSTLSDHRPIKARVEIA